MQGKYEETYNVSCSDDLSSKSVSYGNATAETRGLGAAPLGTPTNDPVDCKIFKIGKNTKHAL